MPRIIVKIYHSKAKKCPASYAEYIAKRDGVDKSINMELSIEKPTKNQIDYINRLLEIAPDAKDTFEYEDYINNPTIENASNFISIIAEQNPDIFPDTQTYVNYIATRPRVEKRGDHGLFGDEDFVNLNEVKKEINSLGNTIWTPIISLNREDAEKTGYNNAEAWRELIKSKQMDLAKIFNIPYDNFRWYCAYHDEGYHPHVHMVVYSTEPKQGFITENNFGDVKKLFAKEIFKYELYQLYDEKTKKRDMIADSVKEKIANISETISKKDFNQSPVCDKLLALSSELKSLGGKKSYGYLPPKIKGKVNDIVRDIAADKDISQMYSEWCEIQNKIIGTYKSKYYEHPDLSENDTFKKIKNAIISEAVKLADNRILIISNENINDKFQDENTPDISNEESSNEYEKEIQEKFETDKANPNSEDKKDMMPVAMSVLKLFYRMSKMIEHKSAADIDRCNSKAVDSKTLKEIMEKKRQMGTHF